MYRPDYRQVDAGIRPFMSVLAAAHTHRGLLIGVVLICSGLVHLAFRRWYARRNAAVETARRETAIMPFRRHWAGITSERGNLVFATVASSVMVAAGALLVALSL